MRIPTSIATVIILTGCAHHAPPLPIHTVAAPAAPPVILVESIWAITNAAGQTFPMARIVISNSTPTTLWFIGSSRSNPRYFAFERVDGWWGRTSEHSFIYSMHFDLRPGATTRFTVGLGQHSEFGRTDATVVALDFSAVPGGEALTALSPEITTGK